MDEYLKNFKDCLQKEPPFCGVECPFHMNVHDFVDKLRKGMWNAAFKVYRNAVGFPRVAAALCHAPCKTVCPLSGRGGAVEMPLLERACLTFAKDLGATGYNVPAKRGRVAIVGAGVSGLACALRLSAKKYDVEVFEREAIPGGGPRESAARDLFMSDIEAQFEHEKYELRLSCEIRDRAFLTDGGFDAVYVATGEGGEDFGLLRAEGDRGDRYCARDGGTAWFAGGSLIGDDRVYALAGGLHMGTVIDNYLKTGSLLYPSNKAATRMVLDAARLTDAPAVVPGNGESYAEDEAREEASRCLKCQCDACKLYGDLCDFTGKWPLRIRDEIAATILPGASEVKATPAKRLLSASNLANVCREICPAEIDLEGLILEGRRSMHRQGKAPWAFHDFWLRDMDFADGPEAALCGAPAKTDGSGYAFFPGCQLGAGDPGLVEAAYAALLARRPGTAIFLRCCGVPAEWAGDEERHAAKIAEIRDAWRGLGEPVMLCACPSCMEVLTRRIPEMTVRSVYEAFADPDGRVPVAARAGRNEWAVFDPCAARRDAGLRSAVRRLALSAGCELTPLPEQEKAPRCCGYGGQPAAASPEFARFVAEKRASESELPYITYCANCKDSFRKAGKDCAHILEILFGPAGADRRPPDAAPRLATVTERRRNRAALKRSLLEKYWGEPPAPADENADEGPRLAISEALLAQMDEDRILEDEIREVVAFCERTGRRVYIEESGSYGGYRKIGHMSYWVDYRPAGADGGFELLRAYAHRMEIVPEAVWNGVRTVAEQ
jgi:Fe-S oxidoreductase